MNWVAPFVAFASSAAIFAFVFWFGWHCKGNQVELKQLKTNLQDRTESEKRQNGIKNLSDDELNDAASKWMRK